MDILEVKGREIEALRAQLGIDRTKIEEYLPSALNAMILETFYNMDIENDEIIPADNMRTLSKLSGLDLEEIKRWKKLPGIRESVPQKIMQAFDGLNEQSSDEDIAALGKILAYEPEARWIFAGTKSSD